jgi:hypothetical protein
MNSLDDTFTPQARKYLVGLYLSKWFLFSPSEDGDWFVFVDWNHSQKKILNDPNSHQQNQRMT